MAKFTRSSLSRGTRLVRQAVVAPLQAIATALGSASIGKEHLSHAYAPFRINLFIPTVDSELYEAWTRPGDTSLCIPFVMPPLQDAFDTSGKVGQSTPTPILDEVSVSFDQRSEPAMITDRHRTSVLTAGRLDFNADSSAYDLKLSLVSKRQWYFDNTQSDVPDREVMSVDIPGVAFLSAIDRTNPFVLTGLNRPVNPYHTYMLILESPGLYSASATYALPALQVSFKFRYPLVSADTEAQNFPTVTGSTKTYTISNPASASIINATPIHNNVKVLDDALSNKLQGGRNLDGSLPANTQLAVEDCYTVYAIPMWSNFGNRRLIADSDQLLYHFGIPAAPLNHNTDNYYDRHVIPLSRSFVLHHAFACVNRCGPATTSIPPMPQSTPPSSGTMSHKIGVGMLVGPQADNFTYQQVAYQDFTIASKVGYTVDRISSSPNQVMTTAGLSGEGWNWEVLNLPLVTVPADPGTGYYTQGKPIYMGRGTSLSTARSHCGGNAPANTDGQESHLEVRWRIEDPVGLTDFAATFPGAAGSTADTYVGYGGHWVILIGKTPLTNPGHDSTSGLLI